MKVVFSSSRGHYLQLSSPPAELPPIFIQAVQQRKTISATTQEVLSLSDRASESISDCLLLTNDLLQILQDEIRKKISAIFTFVDSISLLDMLLGFADLVALSDAPFTRPVLKQSGPMVIRRGRHPIVEKVQKIQPFVENDTFLSAASNFQIITGCNGAGKTVGLNTFLFTMC